MKADKILERMASNKRDWSMKDFLAVADELGIDHRNNGTTHFVFCHQACLKHLSIPNHKDIHPDYVTKFLKMVEKVKLSSLET